MNQAVKAAGSPSLSEAKRAFTRAHVCAAGREVFFREGFARATFEQIAEEAGTKRTTLYAHFRDKDEILEVLAADYAAKLCAVVARLPEGTPSSQRIVSWIDELAEFVRLERAPTIFLIDLGSGPGMPKAVRGIGDALMRALAARIPAFNRAMGTDQKAGMARAWARVVLRELSWASLEYARGDDEELARNLLVVAGRMFEQFVREFD